MESKAKALVEKEGNIRLMFDMSDFKWEKIEAWRPDLKFRHEFHKKIQKMAVVGAQKKGEVDNSFCPLVLR